MISHQQPVWRHYIDLMRRSRGDTQFPVFAAVFFVEDYIWDDGSESAVELTVEEDLW